MKSQNIIVTAFITLVSTFLMIGIIYLLLTGRPLSVKFTINALESAREQSNFIKMIVDAMQGEGAYDKLTTLEKTMYFTQSGIKSIKGLWEISGNGNIIAEIFLKIFQVFTTILSGLLVILGFIIDILFNVIRVTMTIVMTIGNLLFNEAILEQYKIG